MSGSHGLKIVGSEFWVIHRRKTYGPFDYEWSKDFAGVELVYQGEKFGEYCSQEEIYVDLGPFHLPQTVVKVTSIVLGCIVYGVLNGLPEPKRLTLIRERITEFGLSRYLPSAADSVEPP